jgi:hypothetical protein
VTSYNNNENSTTSCCNEGIKSNSNKKNAHSRKIDFKKCPWLEIEKADVGRERREK